MIDYAAMGLTTLILTGAALMSIRAIITSTRELAAWIERTFFS